MDERKERGKFRETIDNICWNLMFTFTDWIVKYPKSECIMNNAFVIKWMNESDTVKMLGMYGY